MRECSTVATPGPHSAMLFQQLCDVRIQLILDILPVGPVGVLGFVAHELFLIYFVFQYYPTL